MIINIDVSKLPTHEEKCDLVRSFEQLGWETAIGKLEYPDPLIPKAVITRYQFTWRYNSEPVYPEIPSSCILWNAY